MNTKLFGLICISSILISSPVLSQGWSTPPNSGSSFDYSATETDDTELFNRHIQGLENWCRTGLTNPEFNKCFKGVVWFKNTAVVKVDPELKKMPYNIKYTMLKEMAAIWRREIGYEAGVSLRTLDGVWLGGIGTHNLQFYPPN